MMNAVHASRALSSATSVIAEGNTQWVTMAGMEVKEDQSNMGFHSSQRAWLLLSSLSDRSQD